MQSDLSFQQQKEQNLSMQPQYQNQPQYYIQPQTQQQPQVNIQIIQQNPITLEVNDSNWCNKMICVIIWFAFWLICSIFSFLSIGGYYSYLTILFIIAAIFIIVSIITKKTNLYKIGFYIYWFYMGLDTLYLCFFIWGFLWFPNIYQEYLRISPYINIYYFDSAEQLEKYIFSSYKNLIIINSIIFVKSLIQSIFIKYLKGKIKIFEAYELYAKNKGNRLIPQQNAI